MTNYLTGHGKLVTPQSEPIPGSDQVQNTAGGYAFGLSDEARFRRFLILGSEGGTYYASERKLTTDNCASARRYIAANGLEAVRELYAISVSGRAPKQGPTLWALAACAAADDVATRRAAIEVLGDVCRTGTMLFQFAEFVQQERGWGRALRRGVAEWYSEKDPAKLAYQAVKYRQREGWTHRDLLRLSHPKPSTPEIDNVFRFILDKAELEGVAIPDVIHGFILAQQAKTPKESAKLIVDYKLPREAVRPEHLTDPGVWTALLENMPMTALIRNLGNLSKAGLLGPLSDSEKTVVAQLSDSERLRKARVHPIQVLSALRVYASGHGARGHGSWSPSGPVVDALDSAFYACFGNVEPARKKTLIALDVSGSMDHGTIAGIPGLTPRDASVAMALVTAKTEPYHGIIAFTSSARSVYSTEITESPFTAGQRIDDAIRRCQRLSFGATDCALPMLYALKGNRDVDTFVVYTDNETWAGTVHPSQALLKYRQASGRTARLVVVGMTATNFSIADPKDPDMMDVVGFDSGAPQILSEFSKGTL